MTDLASLYPGDGYVDWTGLDGYNWGTNPASARGWRSFDQLFRDTYDEIVEGIAPSKPMMLAEVGSSEHGGSKAEWIRDALARVPAEYQQVRAFLWFDKFDDNMDWPIETSADATQAFAEQIQQPVYVGAGYGGLSGGPIAPPS
jgi:beta-mannanase